MTREVTGRNLHEAWPALSPVAQARAIDELWERARAIHGVGPSVRQLVPRHGGYIPESHSDAQGAGHRTAGL